VKAVLLIPAFCMSGCDYFSVESQLYRDVNGLYGLNSNCVYVNPGENPPEGKSGPVFSLLDIYELDNRSCRLTSITKDGSGYILSGKYCTSDYTKISVNEFTYKDTEPFELRVESIRKHTITVKEKDKPVLTLIECGSN